MRGFGTRFVEQRKTLVDPEAMLLIHDGEAQTRKADALLHQGMRPDDERRALRDGP